MMMNPPPLDSLTEREVEIAHLMGDGLSNQEIADKLFLTHGTVKWYSRQIYSKLGVSTRAQAIKRIEALPLTGTETPKAAHPASTKPALPMQLTAFIGREREIEEITGLARANRLLTLTGTGGTGKTRLALQAATGLAGEFGQGVEFVWLAPVATPALVADRIADTLGVVKDSDAPMLETLTRALRDAHLLLALDNFEHVLDAAPLVSDLLEGTRRLHILVTSREALRLYGEQEYPVPPLDLPAGNDSPEMLRQRESVALFLRRAQAVNPGYQPTDDELAIIARICERLDGLPLAIELAAARSRLLPPQALLARLDNRLSVLTGGIRDLPERQQTLRATIDWSYQLLSNGEKMLFARLAVFRGGRSLDAIEAICSPGLAMDALEGVESLMNKNLLRQQPGIDGEPRFVMLETIHEYARERLAESGQETEIRTRHAAYFLQLAERAEPELRRAGVYVWLKRLEMEHDNIERALEWAEAHDDADRMLRILDALGHYWVVSNRFVEGERWILRALARFPNASAHLRTRVMSKAAYVLFFLNKPHVSIPLTEEALRLAYETEDTSNIALALCIAARQTRTAENYAMSLQRGREALALYRELDDQPGMAQSLNIIGELARAQGDDALAQTAYEECLAIVKETGEKRRESMLNGNLGYIAKHRGEIDRAEALFREGLRIDVAYEHDHYELMTSLVPLAGALGLKGQPELAVRVFGAVEAALEVIGAQMQVTDQPEYEHDLAAMRAQFDAETFAALWAEGRTMTLHEAVGLVR